MSAPVYRCGRRTGTGQSCRRRVHSEGLRCTYHGGAPWTSGRLASPCSVEGCERPQGTYASGRCETHERRRKQNHPDADGPIAERGTVIGWPCSIAECGRPAQLRVDGRRVCSVHGDRHRRGMPDWDAPLPPVRGTQPRTPGKRRPLMVHLPEHVSDGLRTLAGARALSMSRLASELLEHLVAQAKHTATASSAAARAIDSIGWVQRPDAWEGR